VLAEGEHVVGEHGTPEFGHEHHMREQKRHALAGAPIGRGCRCALLWSWCAYA
jgi:hypothetical protein